MNRSFIELQDSLAAAMGSTRKAMHDTTDLGYEHQLEFVTPPEVVPKHLDERSAEGWELFGAYPMTATIPAPARMEGNKIIQLPAAQQFGFFVLLRRRKR
jgi:hypothetical protein